MKLLLPVDSRIEDTQGFIILDTKTGELKGYETIESLDYCRKGFRGGCLVGRKLFVCNSYSIKIFIITGSTIEDLSLSLIKQISRPEWLIGRGANADLHMLHYEKISNRLYLANSYMDCIDVLSLDGDLIERRFLWEISDFIRSLVPSRNTKVADLCHINHIESFAGRILITLGNLNGTGMGAIIDYKTGEIVIDGLHRPHDGVLSQGEYFITETSKKRILVFTGVDISEIEHKTPKIIDLSGQLEIENNNFWARGLYLSSKSIFVACSQFQDRNNNSQTLPSHVLVIDRTSFEIKEKFIVPTLGNLKRPVLYSLINLDSILGN